MTQKALRFVVSGMLNDEREITEERVAFILNMLPEHVLDGFTDGFVMNATVNDPSALLEFVKRNNKGKVLTSLLRTNFSPATKDGSATLEVECERVVYLKEGGKDWDTRDTKSDEYCVKQVKTYTDNIALFGFSIIPGVELAIF
jgi:hypothetical protein